MSEKKGKKSLSNGAGGKRAAPKGMASGLLNPEGEEQKTRLVAKEVSREDRRVQWWRGIPSTGKRSGPPPVVGIRWVRREKENKPRNSTEKKATRQKKRNDSTKKPVAA